MKHDQRQKPQAKPTPSPQGQGARQAPAPLAGHSYAAGQALRSLQAQPAELRARPEPSSLHKDAAALHDALGQQIAAAAVHARVPEASLAAILLTEQHFLPARVDDRLPLRFLPYEFWLATGRWLVDSHKDQAAEYRALEEAQNLNPQAALQATRMGMAQVCGAEAQAAGYPDAQAMHADLQADPGAQVRALGALAGADAALGDAMRAQDWRTVAALRAGPAAGALGYEDALAAFANHYQPFATGDDDGPPKRKKR